MSYVDSIKKSNRKINKNIIGDKKNIKNSKNKIIFNTMFDLEKFNYYKNKKISKSKSSSVIIQKRKTACQ